MYTYTYAYIYIYIYIVFKELVGKLRAAHARGEETMGLRGDIFHRLPGGIRTNFGL